MIKGLLLKLERIFKQERSGFEVLYIGTDRVNHIINGTPARIEIIGPETFLLNKLFNGIRVFEDAYMIYKYNKYGPVEEIWNSL